MMVGRAVNVVAAGFLSVVASLGADPVSWLPPQADLVMKLSLRGPSEDLESFREMMVFVTDSSELVGAVPAPWMEEAEQLVVGQWMEEGGRRAVAILKGELSSFRGQLSGHVVVVAAPDVAIFGAPLAVARCLMTQGKQPLLEELQNSVEARFQAPQAGWVWMAGDWPGFVRVEPAWPSWTLRGARENLRSSILLASIADGRIRFETATDVGNDRAAQFLAAELKEHLATVGPGDDSSMQKSLDESQVDSEGKRVFLRLDLSGEVVRQLARSQNALQVLRWRLGSALREERESILDLASMMELKEGSRVADVGSGRGFLAVRLARLVGEKGEVYAVDISEKALESMRQRADFQRYPQLRPVLGAEDDPKLPEGSVDAAIIINAYHEMPKHAEMLRAIWASLRPGGRFLLLEPYSLETRAETREQQVEKHHLAPELVEGELKAMGFEILRREDEFVKPDDPESSQRNGLVLARKPQPES